MGLRGQAGESAEPEEGQVVPPRPGFWKRLVLGEDAETSRLAARTPAWWVFGILLLTVSLHILFDPFGFSRLTQRYAQDISNLTLTGLIYPRTGQNQVSVARIDDSTLSGLGGLSWPVPYDFHATVLGRFLDYHPRAVVVDILFVDPRDDSSLQRLLTVVDNYKRANIPLYFVGAPRTSTPTRSEIAASGVKLVDPTLVLDQGVARQYLETVSCLAADRIDGKDQCPSLAWRVYQDVFASQAAPTNNPESRTELVWGLGTHPINRKWMRVTGENGNPERCPAEPGLMTRIFWAIADLPRLRSACPYPGVIPVEELVRGNDDPDIDTLVRNRVVFYGASLSGNNDEAFSPVNGLVGGVYVHAMALDNLISFEGRPKRDSARLLGITLGKDMVEILAIIPVLLILTAVHIRRIRKLASAGGEEERPGSLNGVFAGILERLGWYGSLLALVLGTGALLYFVFDVSVGNWVAIVFDGMVLFEHIISPVLGRLWGGFCYALGMTA